ncbi:MAG: hypothetical protein GXO79_13625 [Chlorobi bacterium]|nr:hypothetical protein [Chlorobiota bacterium]
MNIRLKILSGFLILVLMLLVAGVISIYEFSKISNKVDKILNENYVSINATKSMITALEREDSGILLLLLGSWDEGRKVLKKADSAFIINLSIASRNLIDEKEIALIKNISKQYTEYKKIWKHPIVGTKKEHNFEWYNKNLHHRFLMLSNSIQELTMTNQNIILNYAKHLKDKAQRAVMPGIIAIVSALLFSFIFSFFIHFYIANPISKITKRINDFILYKTPFEINIDTKDEIKSLADSIKELISGYSKNAIK